MPSPVSADITPAMEDYLETILALSAEGGVARARDIASAMKVSRPSVTGALRHLSKHGLVNYAPYEVITLTSEGAEAARRVARRHEILSRFLGGALGVSERTAERDACRIEHGLSRETVGRLVALMEFLGERPGVVRDWTSRRDAPRPATKRTRGERGARRNRREAPGPQRPGRRQR